MLEAAHASDWALNMACGLSTALTALDVTGCDQPDVRGVSDSL